MALGGKNILLAVSGSIAAYKSAFLVRLLVKAGCNVKVLMTRSSIDFISPLTFSTLSGNPVLTSISDEEAWNNHVELGLWADIMLIAPATATTISRMASGLADNLVVACYLSARCKVFVAPAMDVDMWKHPALQRNISLLKQQNVQVLPVGYGELASGLEGEGRMAEPDEIIQYLNESLNKEQFLKGKKVLITGGPTFEAIDPVRFIGNRSSGKMAFALADECHERGAEVTMVSGPVSIKTNDKPFKVINVESAQEMLESVKVHFPDNQIIIFAAAVADFKSAVQSTSKIKKRDDTLTLTLVPTADIAAEMAKIKRVDQISIGFALETEDETENALKKLHKKKFDFIVLNSLNDKGAGFQHDTNQITILKNDGSKIKYNLKSKTEVAADILEVIKEVDSK